MRAALDAAAERAARSAGGHARSQRRRPVPRAADAITRWRARTCRSPPRSATGRWEHAPFRYLAWWFWRVHGPLMLALKGYIPTGGGWAGLPLPRGVYEEWRRWCLRPDHFGPDLRHLSVRQLFRRDPRAGAERRIQRRSHRDAAHRRGARTSSIRTRARVALVLARRRRLRSASATKASSPRAIATPCGARSSTGSTTSSGSPHERIRNAARPPITSRPTTGWRSMRRRWSRCWRRAHRTKVWSNISAPNCTPNSRRWRAPPRASESRARRGAASTCCPASWARSSDSFAAANGPTTSCGWIPSTSPSAD